MFRQKSNQQWRSSGAGTAARMFKRIAVSSTVATVAVVGLTVNELGAANPPKVLGSEVGRGRTPSATSGDTILLRQRSFDLINDERIRVGLAKLEYSSDLEAGATRWSTRIAADGTFDHDTDLSAGLPATWLLLGENLGKGQSVEGIHTALLNSPTHRANILSTSFEEVGLSVTESNGRLVIVQRFRQNDPRISPGVALPTNDAAPASFGFPE